MNEQVVNGLNQLSAQFGITIDWTNGDVMPYLETLCKKYINFAIWSNIAWCVAWFSLFAITFFVARSFHKKMNETEDSWGDSDLEIPTIFAYVVSGFLGVIAIVFLLCAINTIVTCIAFPEKAVFDYIMRIGK